MWRRFFGKFSKESPTDQLKLGTREQHLLEKFPNTPQQEPLSTTLLMLIWTAGPVTLLTLCLATWIGYGEAVPSERVVYFLTYSAIAGLLGIFTKLIFNTIQGRRKKKDKNKLMKAIDRLPGLIYIARDLRLANLV